MAGQAKEFFTKAGVGEVIFLKLPKDGNWFQNTSKPPVFFYLDALRPDSQGITFLLRIVANSHIIRRVAGSPPVCWPTGSSPAS